MYTHFMKHRMGLYEKAMPDHLTLVDKLQTVKSLGFDFLELSIDESDERLARLDWTDEEIYTLRRASEQHNIPIQSLCLSAHRRFPYGSANEDTRIQAEIIMQKAISLAYKLGIRTIQLAGYDVYYEQRSEKTHQRFVQGMKQAAQLAERAGIMLAVEIMDTDYLNALSKFEILGREVNSPYFTAYPDVGNISGWNYDIETELTLSRHHITQIHLKDTLKVSSTSKGQFRDLVIGEGEVDFNAVFATLKRTECYVPLVLEMWAKDEHWQSNILQAQYFLNQICLNQELTPLFPELDLDIAI